MTKFGRVLLVIVAIAFGIRVAYVAVAKRGPCPIILPSGARAGSSPSSCLHGDEVFYNSEANFVAAGHGFNEPLYAYAHPGQGAPPAADHPPLTVFVLAPVSWLSERPPLSWIVKEPLADHVREQRYAMVLLGTLVVFLVGLLGRRIGGETVGLVAAAIAAVSPNIWVNDGLVMSETLTVLTIVAALLGALWWRDRPSWTRSLVLGGLCGLAVLARVEYALLVPLLAVVVVCASRRPWSERPWSQRVQHALLVCLAALVVVGPWVGFNLARFDDPAFVSTNDGLTLAGANCAKVYYGSAIGFWTLDCTTNTPAGDQSQVSAALRHRGISYIKDHASRVPVVVLARLGRTWSLFRPGDMVQLNTGEDREKWVSRLGLVAYYPTLLLAIVGAFELWRRRARAALWVIVVPVIIVTLNTMVTYGITRFRAGAEPSLAVLAAVGAVALVHGFRARRSVPAS